MAFWYVFVLSLRIVTIKNWLTAIPLLKFFGRKRARYGLRPSRMKKCSGYMILWVFLLSVARNKHILALAFILVLETQRCSTFRIAIYTTTLSWFTAKRIKRGMVPSAPIFKNQVAVCAYQSPILQKQSGQVSKLSAVQNGMPHDQGNNGSYLQVNQWDCKSVARNPL